MGVAIAWVAWKAAAVASSVLINRIRGVIILRFLSGDQRRCQLLCFRRPRARTRASGRGGAKAAKVFRNSFLTASPERLLSRPASPEKHLPQESKTLVRTAHHHAK